MCVHAYNSTLFLFTILLLSTAYRFMSPLYHVWLSQNVMHSDLACNLYCTYIAWPAKYQQAESLCKYWIYLWATHCVSWDIRGTELDGAKIKVSSSCSQRPLWPLPDDRPAFQPVSASSPCRLLRVHAHCDHWWVTQHTLYTGEHNTTRTAEA